ncbi:hypothetical protein Hanom_Chr08g00749211 [Helianthus anomalus]
MKKPVRLKTGPVFQKKKTTICTPLPPGYKPFSRITTQVKAPKAPKNCIDRSKTQKHTEPRKKGQNQQKKTAKSSFKQSEPA